ncbi:MAG TPA: aspartate--tRNA ligase, partial [Candidatus Nanoarchaeia archaeon]|nr:aspartate--tRNA ligase [Candidatus Nanoarchaeia archaeon]
MKRTHTCGELTAKNVDEKVKLAGWVHSRRDHGGIIFIDLRDRYGLTQVVFDPQKSIESQKAHAEAEHLRREDVIQILGAVKKRKDGMINENLPTGEIEVFVDRLKILSKAEIPPIEIDDKIVASDEVRLKYRYLDLRRPVMQKRLILRHNVVQAIREYFNSNGFLEIETPLLVRHTPEGARDYIVPSRVNPGRFYSLPQSPQLYKQVLMVSGMDKYYQIARCLRDEDLRADRQPEFTQLDVEMSFIDEEDVYSVGEGVIKNVFSSTLKTNLKTPFRRITYAETMDKYGCDKPDLRFGLELVDVSSAVEKSEFEVFKKVIKEKGIVKCIIVEQSISRNEIDDLANFVVQLGAKGLAWMKVSNGKLEGTPAKFFNEDAQEELLKKTRAKEGSTIFFMADQPKKANDILSRLRTELGKRLKLIGESQFLFAWIIDFPLFEWNEEDEKWDAAHHIFTMPKEEHMQFLESNPEKVIGQLYDLTLNGVELASGSIRIHNSEIQEKVMKVIGIKKEEAEKKFGFLLEAFKYGAPPHGGF